MEKYEKVVKTAIEREQIPDNVVRVNARTQVKSYVRYILKQFEETKVEEVTLSSMGNAMAKMVTIAEIVKHRVAGLYQVNSVEMQTFEDEYKPKEEGLDNVKLERKVTCFRVHLSLKEATASRNAEPGYQAPMAKEEVIPENGPEESEARRQPRSRKGKNGDDEEDGDDLEEKPLKAPATKKEFKEEGEAVEGENAEEKKRRSGRRRGGRRRGGRAKKEGEEGAEGEAPKEKTPQVEGEKAPQEKRERPPRQRKPQGERTVQEGDNQVTTPNRGGGNRRPDNRTQRPDQADRQQTPRENGNRNNNNRRGGEGNRGGARGTRGGNGGAYRGRGRDQEGEAPRQQQQPAAEKKEAKQEDN